MDTFKSLKRFCSENNIKLGGELRDLQRRDPTLFICHLTMGKWHGFGTGMNDIEAKQGASREIINIIKRTAERGLSSETEQIEQELYVERAKRAPHEKHKGSKRCRKLKQYSKCEKQVGCINQEPLRRNAIVLLHEHQTKNNANAMYSDITTIGPPHSTNFRTAVTYKIDGKIHTRFGWGFNKKSAKQAASEQAMLHINSVKNHPHPNSGDEVSNVPTTSQERDLIEPSSTRVISTENERELSYATSDEQEMHYATSDEEDNTSIVVPPSENEIIDVELEENSK